MWWFMSPKIAFGEDALEILKEVKGKRGFIVTDKVIRCLGFADIVLSYLKEAGFEVEIFDGVEPEPSVENVLGGAEPMRKFAPDLIVGLGGGSCIDAAKAMWVLYERPDLKELIEIGGLTPLAELGLRKKARLIAIPTTSGTGSDATWATVITDKKTAYKMEMASRELLPDISILDPKLVMGMPKQLTADTGLDVLAHAIEGYVSQWRNDFSDAMAMGAIKLVFRFLPRAYEDGNDAEAREKMHFAATMAGLAFGNSQVGIAHSMGHSLGAVFHIPHGRTVGFFLPYVIEYSSKVSGARYAEIAKAIDIEAESEEEAVEKLVSSIRDLMKRMGIPLSVKEMGISWEDYERRLEELVAKASRSACTFVNPRVPNEEDLRKLFICAFEGKKVDF